MRGQPAWGALETSRGPLAREVLAQEELEAPGGMQLNVAGGNSSLLAPVQAFLSAGHGLAAFSALTSLLGTALREAIREAPMAAPKPGPGPCSAAGSAAER